MSDSNPAAGRGTILLVEDERQVRRLLTRVLEGAGHRVFAAQDGARALELWTEIDQLVDLVVTDVVMPGPSGPELVRRLRRDRPDLPVLFISAYQEDEIGPEEDPGDPFLPKPFSPRELLEVVEPLI